MTEYPVRGVDVSSYQGEIDWKTLSSQNLSFAFIKATEGSSFVDPCFDYNYEKAQKTDLRIGAYHFFSYDSSGEDQAENFISTVSKIDNMLPPVIDLEFYGDKEKNPPEQKAVREQLDRMLKNWKTITGKNRLFMPPKSPILSIWQEFMKSMIYGFGMLLRGLLFQTTGNGHSGSTPIVNS